MSEEEKKQGAESSSVPHSTPITSSAARPNSLGTGSRSPSGTISLDSITPKSSYDELAIKSSSHSQDEESDVDVSMRSRAHTADVIVQQQDTTAPTRPRLYSEEDEELRKAKAMALAIQQHPNMTPEEIHAMHIGDETQSNIIQQASASKPRSDTFLGSIRESQKKTKELFQTMVGTTSLSSSSTTPSAKASSQASIATPSSARSTATAASDTVKSPTADKTPVLSPTAVAKRAVDKAPKPQQVAKAVKDKATLSPPLAGTQQASPPSAAAKKKYPVMAAAKAKANSGAAAAKAKASSAANKAKEKMKATTKKRNSSAMPTSSQQTSPESLVRASAPPTIQNQVTDDEGTFVQMNIPSTNAASTNKVRLSANVWKRRGGMGKLSYSKAWERRKVVLQGNRLFYFKNEDDTVDLEQKDAAWFDQAALNLEKAKGAWLATDSDPDAPRGYFDLLKEGATVAASSGHSGAPSPFAISIKVRSDTVWKLCFDSHAGQMEWLAALTDVVVSASVDTYNANLLLAADPSHEATMFDLEYRPPPGSKEAGQQLWMVGSYRVSSVGLDDDLSEAGIAETERETSSTAASSDEELIDVDRFILQEQDMRVLFVIVNAALVLSRSSAITPQQFWYILTFCNMGIGYYLIKGYKKRDTSSAPAVVAASGLIKSIVVPEETALDEEEEDITGEKPVAGTTTVKLENPSDSPVRDGQVFGAWCAPPGEVLAVRSQGYGTTKQKVPSPGELYELINVDIFESPHRYPDMARRVKLPKVTFEGEDPSTKTWYAPDIFIVSVALPTDPPKMRSSDDGGGFTITMYFAMKQKTRDILRRVTAESYDPLQEPTPEDVQKSTVNAVKLFNEYCRRAPTDPAFQGRFKLVANAQNLKEIGMPSWISKYNGKPVLIKRAGQTGFLFSHPKLSCMEFDVSFHPFPYLAKQAISYMKDNFFKKVLVTFGFVIEGRSDDELPECVIGLMQLCYPDPTYAIQAADFFAGTSPRSF